VPRERDKARRLRKVGPKFFSQSFSVFIFFYPAKLPQFPAIISKIKDLQCAKLRPQAELVLGAPAFAEVLKMGSFFSGNELNSA
jgi:hypothetical protein